MPVPFPLRHRSEAGVTLASVAQYLVAIGLLVGLFLLGGQIFNQAKTVLTISKIKTYDTAVRSFRSLYQALPGDIPNPGKLLAGCAALPCSAGGNGDMVIADRKPLLSSVFYFQDTSENRTFWLHLAITGLLSGIKSDGTKSQYFGQWGVEFPKASIGIPGGFHIAYYTVSSTPYSPVSLLGHYAVLRGATDTSGIAAAPYALTARVAQMIDKKMDDGLPLSGRVISLGSAACVDKSAYNGQATDRGCNMLFQLSF